MKTVHIAKHIAILLALGATASAQAQLLGGRGPIGGSLNGMVGGAGNIGGQLTGAGSMAGRGALIGEARSATRIIDTSGIRRSAELNGNGNAGGNGAASLASNVLPRSANANGEGSGSLGGTLNAAREAAVPATPASPASPATAATGSGQASGSGTMSGGVNTDGVGNAMQAAGALAPVRDGARAQADTTRTFAAASAANTRSTVKGSKQAAVDGSRQASGALGSAGLDKTVALDASGSLSGNGAASANGPEPR